MGYNVFIREEFVDGVNNWVWPAGDTGAWEGPRTDWETSHKPKILKHVSQFKTVVQAGGNCGMYPRLLSEMFEVVYTFEPDPLNFYCLVNNCQRDNVIKINSALGSSHNTIRVNRHPIENVGMHTVTQDDNSYLPQLMVDDLDLKYCDLLMLDVEGYESHIITGAGRTIEKFKPVIFAENGGNEILSQIEYLGYKIIEKSVSDTIYKVG